MFVTIWNLLPSSYSTDESPVHTRCSTVFTDFLSFPLFTPGVRLCLLTFCLSPCSHPVFNCGYWLFVFPPVHTWCLTVVTGLSSPLFTPGVRLCLLTFCLFLCSHPVFDCVYWLFVFSSVHTRCSTVVTVFPLSVTDTFNFPQISWTVRNIMLRSIHSKRMRYRKPKKKDNRINNKHQRCLSPFA